MNDLISRSALLEDIRESVVFSGRSSELSAEMRGAHKVTDRIKVAPTIEQPQWISVEDRLPTEAGVYLVFQNFDAWGVGHKAIGMEWFVKQLGGWCCDGVKNRGITHWMPLPQPPKGE